MEPLLLRPTPRQIRNLRTVTLIALLATAGTSALAAYKTHAMTIAWACGSFLVTVLYGHFYLAMRKDFTEAGPDGIRCRAYGKRHACRWVDVESIEIRSTTRRGGVVTNGIVVTPKSGKPFALSAPVSNSLTPDPELMRKYESIRASWRAGPHSGNVMRDGHEQLPVRQIRAFRPRRRRRTHPER
ncbi:MAG TPA: hypothetical protein VKB59_08930 [Micromonosporaceae bacterium]|nr:hypothetical protein [Micromonosporaceae bacterium]